TGDGLRFRSSPRDRFRRLPPDILRRRSPLCNRMADVTRTGAAERPRKLRADAQRNHDRIVAVARQAFGEQGLDASLDEIAKRAEVGPGTLYRHFPTRDHLYRAVLEGWQDEVEADGEQLKALAEADPERALIEWAHHHYAQKSFFRGLHSRLL